MSKPRGTSIAVAGFAEEVGASKSHKAFTILPSKIFADHGNNYARAAIYSLTEQLPELVGCKALKSAQICFTRDEVLARVASFTANKQRQAIKVWRTNTHVPYVSEGYLRHLAALFMEVTGALADVPEMKHGLRCEAEEQPKTPEAQVVAAWSNHAENADRKATSPIDDAWLCKRLITMQVSREDIAARLGISKRSVDRKLALLGFPIDVQLAVHEGRLTESQAHAQASERGQGNARGALPGINRRAMRRRNRDDRPKAKLSPEQVDALIDLINGDATVGDITDETVLTWLRYADAPALPREPKASKRAAPPKPGEQPSATT